jgi:hypothetical protein
MKTTAARRNAQLDNLTAQLNSGYIDILSGTKATNADTAIGAQVVLAILTFGSTAFAAANAGSATANAITAGTGTAGAGTGTTATWARLYASNHTTAICDITVGTSGAELNLNTTTIVQNVAVSISSMTLSQPDGT